MKLQITRDTVLKALPGQSTDLALRGIANSVAKVKEGTTLDIAGYAPYEGAPNSDGDDHVYVELTDSIDSTGESRWFVYGMHCKIEGTEPDNDPNDEEPVRLSGPTIRVPGISVPVGLTQPIYQGSNFAWYELTKNGQRIPINATVTQRIVKIVRHMDELREFLDDRPITITSGYRPPLVNRRIGGASNSRHMYGDAVDFRVKGLHPVDVFKRLKPICKRGGLAVGNGFVHRDLRPGAPARWTYPNGPRVALW